MAQSKPRHLLIIRLSAMGDVAMTTPIVRALMKSNPGLRVTFLTRPMFRPFFRDIEGLEFVDVDLKQRHKGFAGLLQLVMDIRELGVTDVADMHDVLRTKFIRTLLIMGGCRAAIIKKGRVEKKMLTRKFRKVLTPLKTSIERYGDVLRELGYVFDDPQPAKHIKKPVPVEVTEFVGKKTGSWIGVAPFAQHRGKIYPTLQTDQLIDLLSHHYDRVFIFGGGRYEKEFAEFVQERYESVFSVIGRIGLDKELDLMSNLEVMVTMDSSSMHMASLMGVRVVSVWGATHPCAGFYGYGQDPADAVQIDMPCRPCSIYGNKPCIFKDYRCLGEITPQMIFDRIKRK